MSNQSSYDTIAPWWKSLRDKMNVNPSIIELAKLLPNHANILDVGCGTAHPIDTYLSELGHKITGIDFSKKMINYAKTNLPHQTFYCLDYFDFSTSQLFDALIAFDSFFHIELEKQKDIYLKASTLLKPGGYLLFTHGKEEGEVSGKMNGQPFTYASLDIPHLTKLLQQAKFKIVELKQNSDNRDLIVLAQKL